MALGAKHADGDSVENSVDIVLLGAKLTVGDNAALLIRRLL